MGKLVTATVAAFLTYAISGFVFYEVLMKEQFAVWEAAVARPEPNLTTGLLAFVLLALLMAWLYPRGYDGGEPWQEGARFGAIVGAIIACTMLIVYSVFELQLAGTLSDIAFNMTVLTVMGALIGIVYGRMDAG